MSNGTTTEDAPAHREGPPIPMEPRMRHLSGPRALVAAAVAILVAAILLLGGSTIGQARTEAKYDGYNGILEGEVVDVSDQAFVTIQAVDGTERTFSPAEGCNKSGVFRVGQQVRVYYIERHAHAAIHKAEIADTAVSPYTEGCG